MKGNKEMDARCVRFWESLDDKQQEEYKTILKYHKERAGKKAQYRFDRNSISKCVHGGIKAFINSHPNTLDTSLIKSLGKRITGSIETYLQTIRTLKEINGK